MVEGKRIRLSLNRTARPDDEGNHESPAVKDSQAKTKSSLAETGPFDLANGDTYRRWRDWKLEKQPRSASDLMVEIADPLHLSDAEKDAVLGKVRVSNMAIYACGRRDAPAEETIPVLAGRFGLGQLDQHLCAEEDGITPLSVAGGGQRQRYIPYTDRPINWHTDGYYNDPRHRVRVFMLHCVRPAQKGGESSLMDPEIAYIRLCDENPDYIAALRHPGAMTIPANEEDGAEIREARTGPVFFVDPDGSLQMRYTARSVSIEWRGDPITQEAVQCLSRVLDAGSPDVIRHRLAPGEGVLANNVLHARTGFQDGEDENEKRLVYRARFYGRIEGTGLNESYS